MEPALFIVAIVVASGHPDASEQAAMAFAKQSGIEHHLDNLQRKYVPPEMGNVAVVAKALIDKQIEFEWRFP